MVNWMSKSLNRTEEFLAIIAGLLILISMISVAMEVMVRSLFGHSFMWVQEYNEYILLYIPFLSGAWLLRNHDHVIINLIDKLLKRKQLRILSIIVASLGTLSMIVLVYYSVVVTLDILDRGVTSTTVLRTPQIFIYIVIPVGSFIMLLEFVRQFWIALKSNGKSLTEQKGSF